MDDRVGLLADQVAVLNFTVFNRLRWELELLLVDYFRTRNMGAPVANASAILEVARKMIPETDTGLQPTLDNLDALSQAMVNLSADLEVAGGLKPILDNFNALSQAMVNVIATVEEGDALIDHLFWRLFQLLLVTVCLVTLAVIIVRCVPSKREGRE
jgi:hypothetical protein